jgi:DNA-binding CsgD family transcriptional regulator
MVFFGIYGLLGSLLAQRILQSLQSPPQLVVSVGHVIPFVGIPFFITGLYMMVKVCLELTGKSISRAFTLGFFMFHLLFFLIYGLLLLKYPSGETVTYTLFPPQILYTLVILQGLTHGLALTFLFRGIRSIREVSLRTGIRNFGFILIAVQTSVLVLFVLSDLSIILTIGYLFLYFAGNLIPLIHLGMVVEKIRIKKPVSMHMESLEDFFVKTEITRREREIIELILGGLTNQEIADRLFITLQTVKDHTHNIYLKTDVRNRVELVNLVRQIEKNTSEKRNFEH